MSLYLVGGGLNEPGWRKIIKCSLQVLWYCDAHWPLLHGTTCCKSSKSSKSILMVLLLLTYCCEWSDHHTHVNTNGADWTKVVRFLGNKLCCISQKYNFEQDHKTSRSQWHTLKLMYQMFTSIKCYQKPMYTLVSGLGPWHTMLSISQTTWPHEGTGKARSNQVQDKSDQEEQVVPPSTQPSSYIRSSGQRNKKTKSLR